MATFWDQKVDTTHIFTPAGALETTTFIVRFNYVLHIAHMDGPLLFQCHSLTSASIFGETENGAHIHDHLRFTETTNMQTARCSRIIYARVDNKSYRFCSRKIKHLSLKTNSSRSVICAESYIIKLNWFSSVDWMCVHISIFQVSFKIRMNICIYTATPSRTGNNYDYWWSISLFVFLVCFGNEWASLTMQNYSSKFWEAFLKVL
jgi:hypothetical protein